MWELDYKAGYVPKNWGFWTVVLEKTLESPLDCKEIKPVNPKGNPSWIFTGRTDAEAESPILCPPGGKSWLIVKYSDGSKEPTHWERHWSCKDRRQAEKGTTEDKMVGWLLWLNEHEFVQTPGDSEAQESQCSATHQLANCQKNWLNKNKEGAGPASQVEQSPPSVVHWGVGSIPAGVTGLFLHLSKAQFVPLDTRAMGEPALRVNVGTKFFLPGKLESAFWGPGPMEKSAGGSVIVLSHHVPPLLKEVSVSVVSGLWPWAKLIPICKVCCERFPILVSESRGPWEWSIVPQALRWGWLGSFILEIYRKAHKVQALF